MSKKNTQILLYVYKLATRGTLSLEVSMLIAKLRVWYDVRGFDLNAVSVADCAKFLEVFPCKAR